MLFSRKKLAGERVSVRNVSSLIIGQNVSELTGLDRNKARVTSATDTELTGLDRNKARVTSATDTELTGLDRNKARVTSATDI